MNKPDRDPDAPTPPERHAPVQVPPLSPPHDGLLLPAVHALVEPYAAAARHGYGPLPNVRSAEFLDAPAAVQLAALLVLAEAWVVGDPHQVVRAMLKQVSRDVHDAMGGVEGVRRWRESSVPGDEMRRRRYPPTGDRDLWIAYGPAGPPRAGDAA